MRHAQKSASRIQKIQIGDGLLAQSVAAQIMQVTNTRRRPPKANFIQLRRRNACEIEARAYGLDREARIVFHAAQSLFGNREKEFAVAHDARRGIVHLRVVDAQADHGVALNPFAREIECLTLPLHDDERMNFL